MTDLEKAIELARKHEGLFGARNREECCVAACQEMAEWKDKQHGVAYVVTRCEEHSDYVEEVFFDIEKAEQYCAKYNSNDDDYRRHITKVNITL